MDAGFSVFKKDFFTSENLYYSFLGLMCLESYLLQINDLLDSVLTVPTFSILVEVFPQSLRLPKSTNVPRSDVEFLVIHSIHLEMSHGLKGDNVAESSQNCLLAAIIQTQHQNPYHRCLKEVSIKDAAALAHRLVEKKESIKLIQQ